MWLIPINQSKRIIKDVLYDFRPSLADQQKVGFFTLDRCSQTEVTEVVELKDMTEVLQLLIKASFIYYFLGIIYFHMIAHV